MIFRRKTVRSDSHQALNGLSDTDSLDDKVKSVSYEQYLDDYVKSANARFREDNPGLLCAQCKEREPEWSKFFCSRECYDEWRIAEAVCADLTCTRREFDEDLSAWRYFVDWSGEDLSGKSVLINGTLREVLACKLGDSFTVLTVRET